MEIEEIIKYFDKEYEKHGINYSGYENEIMFCPGALVQFAKRVVDKLNKATQPTPMTMEEASKEIATKLCYSGKLDNRINYQEAKEIIQTILNQTILFDKK